MNEANPSAPPLDIRVEIEKFVHALDALRQTFGLTMRALVQSHREVHKTYDEYVEKYGDFKEKDGKRFFRMKSHDYCHDFGVLRTELDRTHASFAVVPRSFLVALVSQFDAYLGSLLQSLYYLKPELLEGSDFKLSFGELSTFGNLENARRYVVEKEIETLLRKSHIEQFDALERKFGIKLRVDLPIWSTFVEITERRNLCVHTGAVVSTQYINNCTQEGVDVGKVEPGQQLDVDGKYFYDACKAIYEIGVKLGQVLWRKVLPNQIDQADQALLSLTFALLGEERYRIADVLLSFADTTLHKHHVNEWYRLAFRINRALAAYLQKNKTASDSILAAQDWSAAANEFRLAVDVLREQFKNAATMMRKIGPSSFPHKSDYLHWPLFAEFRKTPEFESVFKELFGDLSHDEEEVAEINEVEKVSTQVQ